MKNIGRTSANRAKFAPLTAVAVLAAAAVLTSFMPDFTDAETFGIYSTIPAIFLVFYIFFTKRMFEGLLLASLMGMIMMGPAEVLDTFSNAILEDMMSEDIAWLILVCGLMGSIIAMLEKAGGAYAFGNWVASRAKTKTGVLMWSWVLGMIIFLDDYLNALVVGSCMAPVCDRHKQPREFLAYIVDSTAAPMCVIIPISTWGVFVGKILEENNWAPDGQGLFYFIKTIPYDIYAWVGVIIIPLFIYGIIKPFGPMKKAYERIEAGGPVAPPGSEKIDIHGGQLNVDVPENPRMRDFLVPIVSLIFFTLFDVTNFVHTGDFFGSISIESIAMERGVYITMAVCFVYYIAEGVLTAEEYWDCTMNGIKNMFNSIMLMILAFLFAAVNEEIGFTQYMIESSLRWMTPQLMPVIVFLVLSITEFVTGSNWGMYIIALPIVIPLAQELGVNVALAVGAVISAGVFGSHICFYSDATVITSAACGCENFAHAKTQIPYGLLVCVITLVAYLACGFLL